MLGVVPMVKLSSRQAGVELVEIDPDLAGQRIDNFLLARLKGVPKSRVYRLLRKGEVRVNKGRIGPEYRLAAQDLVRIPPVRVAESGLRPAPGRGLRELLAACILLENDELLVLNKPAGLAVHGGSGVNLGVIEALRAMRPQQSALELVHRLDRDTSGCLLIAKKRSALRRLQEQMRAGSIEKCYLALVRGHWDKALCRVDAPLRKETRSSGERIVRLDSAGKRAVTHFSVVTRYREATLMEARLETGRTHQIRVHCQSAGHPLAGDPKYGDWQFDQDLRNRGLGRLFLHAAELVFDAPVGGERIRVSAPLPADLRRFLESL